MIVYSQRGDKFRRIRADELFDLDLLEDVYEHIPIDSEDW